MADFNFVTSRLATGAAVSSVDDVNQLAAAGITHIIDCRGEFDDTPLLASHPDMLYLWNGTADDGQHPKPSEWFGKSLAFALPALAHPYEKVYAHCAAGVNRGPSTAYAIMLALGWHAEDARHSIVIARPQVGLAYAGDAEAAIGYLGYS